MGPTEDLEAAWGLVSLSVFVTIGSEIGQGGSPLKGTSIDLQDSFEDL